MRIYLLGFMGAGKTRLGKELAQLMGYSFLDLDQVLVEKAGLSINEVFSQFGEEYFRNLEREALHDSKDHEDVIISTGGGTPCFFDNLEWINNHGLSIYLDVEHQILTNRLWKGRHGRPLLKNLSKNELSSFVEAKNTERKTFYNKAAIHYQVLIEDQKSAEELFQLFNFS